jgi:hypothetical protein
MTEIAAQEAPAPEIITSVPEDFMREFEKEILGQIPAEKVAADLRQAELGRVMQKQGSRRIEGIGQRVAEIDPRLYFRLRQQYSKDYEEGEWIRDFLASNPSMCAPGYKPRRKMDLRHSFTMVNGAPVNTPKTT